MVNKGITGVKVTADTASFLQLFKLTKVVIKYDSTSKGAQTWSVSAKASAGGKASTPFSGSLTYSGGKLTAASLSVGKTSLAGLVDVTSLKVTDSNGTWTGHAVAGTGTNAKTLDITLAFSTKGLESGLIKASDISLFGVLDVSTFALSYSAGTWAIAVAAAGGGSVSGSMTATDGVITRGSLKVKDVSFLGKFTVATAEVSYVQEGPDTACGKVGGESIWCGDWKAQLPSASAVTGVSGKLAVADGAFASGSIEVKGNVPLLDGIFLTKLGGGVTLKPAPTKISGTMGLRFGPQVKGISVLDVDGNLTRELPGGGTSGAYQLNGTLNALGVLTGHVDATVPGDGTAAAIHLNATASVGKATATGTLTGTFTGTTFTLAGAIQLTVFGERVTGASFKADNLGMAACGTLAGKQAGFEYDWDGDLTWYGSTGCKEAGF